MTQWHEGSGSAYARAQYAIAMLESAVYDALADAGSKGLRNVDIGRSLGIYAGQVSHEGHIPRILITMTEKEGVVEQDHKTRRWLLRFPAANDH